MQLLLIFLIDQDILITEIIIKTVELLRQTKTLILMVILYNNTSPASDIIVTGNLEITAYASGNY